MTTTIRSDERIDDVRKRFCDEVVARDSTGLFSVAFMIREAFTAKHLVVIGPHANLARLMDYMVKAADSANETGILVEEGLPTEQRANDVLMLLDLARRHSAFIEIHAFPQLRSTGAGQ